MLSALHIASWKCKINNSSTTKSELCRNAGPSAFQFQKYMLKSDKIWYLVSNCVSLRTFWTSLLLLLLKFSSAVLLTPCSCSVLFCYLAILDPRVATPWMYFLHLSDWLFHGESCPCIDVVHPGRAWSSSPVCTWHCSLRYLFLSSGNSFVSSCFDSVWQFPCYSSFVKNPLICFLRFPWNSQNLLQPFHVKVVKSVCPYVQLSQPNVATGHTSTFISRVSFGCM